MLCSRELMPDVSLMAEYDTEGGEDAMSDIQILILENY